MNSRIRKVLDQIGYNKAKAKNPSLFYGDEFDARGGLAFGNKKEARDTLRKLKKIEQALANLPDRAIELWDHSSRRSEDWDSDRNVLADVINGFREVKKYAENTINHPFNSDRGRSHAADRIAYKMAEIYFVAHGEIPDGMARDSDGAPTGTYTKAVQAMFVELGISEVSYRKPCERAVSNVRDQLTELAKRNGSRARISLFEFAALDPTNSSTK